MAERVNAQKIAEILAPVNTIAIFGHIMPDGDCYGSAYALKLALENMGKQVHSYLSDDVPDYLAYLKDYENVHTTDSFVPADLAIALDGSDVERFEHYDFLYKYRQVGTPIIVIDHHTAGDMVEFADFVWQDQEKSSASEMVLEVLREAGVEIKKDIATLLLTGIETDTSSFQNQNTTAEALDAAAFLRARGARLAQIVNHTFHAKDMDTIKLYGLVLERLIYNEKYGVVTGYLTQDDARNLGIEGDLSTGVANYLNAIEDVKMIIFISETADGTLKVSLRTRDESIDVSHLARALGGGGHVKASGFTVKGKISIENGGVRVV